MITGLSIMITLSVVMSSECINMITAFVYIITCTVRIDILLIKPITREVCLITEGIAMITHFVIGMQV